MLLALQITTANAAVSAGRDDNTADGWFDSLLKELGASEQLELDKGIDWGVLPGPFVNPLQGFGIGVAAIGLYSPEGRKPDTQVSTLGIKSYVSTSGSYGLGVENRTYLGDDSLRLELDAWVSQSPRDYWGTGTQAAQTEANRTAVDASVLELSPRIALRVLPNTYATVGWELQSYRRMSAEGPALSAADLEDTAISGMSLGLAYDSRDFAPNAWEGMLLSAKYDDYLTALGSDREFRRLTLNYRQYQRLAPSLVLAWELYAQGIEGDVPWFALSEVGRDGRMRGYYQGQYRDRYQFNGQVELRQQLTGRHGLVYWLGAGTLADERQQLFDGEWLPTLGVGYRMAFKPRVNIRLDLGIGKDSSGFYFQINEAF
ncbi:BamA/TamA family outer membrane protein [Shewanella sp. GXUN23E]|uniref:BamA/TamA family outer membrane protein n=1 Tax=Shewanella sp. GXUN23E TaxID=3422498 RepID=UPI003D7D7A2C